MTRRILVVYYSRTGTTRRVAEELARLLDGRACAITERGTRLGLFGYARSLWEAASGRDAAIQPMACRPQEADLVLIGTRVWGWHLSSPVRAFARRHRADLRRCAFFCTMGGAGAEPAFAELRRLTGHEPLATLALTDAEIDDGRAAPRLAAFATAVRSALRGRQRRAALDAQLQALGTGRPHAP